MASSISRLIILIIGTLLFSQASEARSSHLIFQYAGDIGKYSAGYGHRFNKYYTLSGHYGFVPSNKRQNKIETYTVKNTLDLYEIGYKNLSFRFYTGAALFHVPGNKYKTQSLSTTEANYYRQSSIRGQLYIGNNVSYGNQVSFYWESGINDIWIINSSNNDSIDPKNHISLALGFNYWIN